MTADFVILSELCERKIHIVILSVSEISTEFKTRFLNLWILRFLAKAQYDKKCPSLRAVFLKNGVAIYVYLGVGVIARICKAQACKFVVIQR